MDWYEYLVMQAQICSQHKVSLKPFSDDEKYDTSWQACNKTQITKLILVLVGLWPISTKG